MTSLVEPARRCCCRCFTHSLSDTWATGWFVGFDLSPSPPPIFKSSSWNATKDTEDLKDTTEIENGVTSCGEEKQVSNMFSSLARISSSSFPLPWHTNRNRKKKLRSSKNNGWRAFCIQSATSITIQTYNKQISRNDLKPPYIFYSLDKEVISFFSSALLSCWQYTYLRESLHQENGVPLFFLNYVLFLVSSENKEATSKLIILMPIFCSLLLFLLVRTNIFTSRHTACSSSTSSNSSNSSSRSSRQN